MLSVLEQKLRNWREFRVQELDKRVAHLTECINGTDEETYPDLVADYHSDRQQAALKRSRIISKLGGQDLVRA